MNEQQKIDQTAIERLKRFCEIAGGAEWPLWFSTWANSCPACRDCISRDIAKMNDGELFKALAGGADCEPTLPDWEVSKAFRGWRAVCLLVICGRRQNVEWN